MEKSIFSPLTFYTNGIVEYATKNHSFIIADMQKNHPIQEKWRFLIPTLAAILIFVLLLQTSLENPNRFILGSYKAFALSFLLSVFFFSSVESFCFTCLVLFLCGIFLIKRIFSIAKTFSGIESAGWTRKMEFSCCYHLPIWCWFTIKSFFLISEKQYNLLESIVFNHFHHPFSVSQFSSGSFQRILLG